MKPSHLNLRPQGTVFAKGGIVGFLAGAKPSTQELKLKKHCGTVVIVPINECLRVPLIDSDRLFSLSEETDYTFSKMDEEDVKAYIAKQEQRYQDALKDAHKILIKSRTEFLTALHGKMLLLTKEGDVPPSLSECEVEYDGYTLESVSLYVGETPAYFRYDRNNNHKVQTSDSDRNLSNPKTILKKMQTLERERVNKLASDNYLKSLRKSFEEYCSKKFPSGVVEHGSYYSSKVTMFTPGDYASRVTLEYDIHQIKLRNIEGRDLSALEEFFTTKKEHNQHERT